MKELLTLLLLGTLLNHVIGQTIQAETCSRAAGHEALIQPNADALIAGFFSMHNHRDGSAFGCGDIYSGGMYIQCIKMNGCIQRFCHNF